MPIENYKDYHNTFSGGYDFGDIVFERLITVNQAHNMYWKKSNNPTDSSKARASRTGVTAEQLNFLKTKFCL